jgi:hypothetical protein
VPWVYLPQPKSHRNNHVLLRLTGVEASLRKLIEVLEDALELAILVDEGVVGVGRFVDIENAGPASCVDNVVAHSLELALQQVGCGIV